MQDNNLQTDKISIFTFWMAILKTLKSLSVLKKKMTKKNILQHNFYNVYQMPILWKTDFFYIFKPLHMVTPYIILFYDFRQIYGQHGR